MLEDVDFGRRMATHRELAQHAELHNFNAIFDESGHFLLYSTLVGIKIVNLLTNKVERILGNLPLFFAPSQSNPSPGKVENTEHFLHVALLQGGISRKVASIVIEV